MELEAGHSRRSWLLPSFYFAKQGPSIEFLPGLAARVHFYNAINEIYLEFGLSSRFVGHRSANLTSTDFIGSTQFIIENFALGFSYDVAISDVRAATGRNGGPEVSIKIDLGFESGRKPKYFKMMK
jgi:hypothetical protein